MQVFTTIFLAETQGPDTGRAEESTGSSEDKRGLFEIQRTSLECIAMLESRNWFLDDLPSED